jgi:hypothetical protein
VFQFLGIATLERVEVIDIGYCSKTIPLVSKIQSLPEKGLEIDLASMGL